MEASRDDFIIAIRSAFLKKGNKQRFSLIGLIFFSIGLLIVSKIKAIRENFCLFSFLKKAERTAITKSSLLGCILSN